MHKTVVKVIGDSDETELGKAKIDVAFQMSETEALRLEKVGDDTLDYLTHHVSRLPVDLRNHCRRILLQYERGDPDSLYSSLLDLFLILEDRGYALRKRMLEGAKGRLRVEQYASLLRSLTCDSELVRPLSSASSSVLSKGIVGVRQVVETTEDINHKESSEQSHNPLAEARACLEYSQIDEAQRILENAIQQQPDDIELHEELLGIYQSTRDKESFLNVFEKLDPVRNPAPDAWEKVANFLIDHD